jgi:outer membrane protein TolC
MKLFSIFLIIVIHFQIVSAQVTLDFETFKKRVLTYHPVIKQAKNIAEIGQKETMIAKGSLDPKFELDISGKQFENVDYYNLSNTGLKIPTWLGVDFKAGYEHNNGAYLNNERYTPSSGLWYAGIEIPIGQGLFFDERRASIQTAKILDKMASNEQELLINDLLLEAFSTYWAWYEAYKRLKITEEGLNFAIERFNGVRENALQGDVPYIDTIEAKIQLDSRKFEKIQAEYDFLNVKALLNIYLWSDNFLPLELEDNTIPQLGIQKDFLKEGFSLRFMNINTSDLPLILNSVYKLEQLKVEEKWKKEQLKPELNFSYNPLSQPVGNNPFMNFSPNNYKFGITAYLPLLLRKERGALSQTKFKIENAKLDLAMKINEMKQKEVFIRNEIYQLYDQYSIQQDQVVQAKQLRDSEQIRFQIGESSLFLVNTREMSYLQMNMKLVEIESKLKITEAKWLWLNSDLN